MTTDEVSLLQAINDRPLDDELRLVFADWLEDDGQADRADLLRLTLWLRDVPRGEARAGAERRVRDLLASGTPPCVPILSNCIGLRLALVPAGRFWMGSESDEAGALDNEARHEVEIGRPFWIGVFPVTQAEYEAVTGKSPSLHTQEEARQDTKRFPVEQVTWDEAVEFCRRLSARAEEAAAGREYRLPTEAEWEYACRGGLSAGAYHFGDALEKGRANFNRSGLDRPSVVGSYPPNAFGLYDVHGNVWEWCDGWYGDYTTGETKDWRVYRGGAWDAPAAECRSAFRGNNDASTCDYNLGFRVALSFRGA